MFRLYADFESHLDYRDDPTLFGYQDRINKGMSPEESLAVLKKTTRDNARTPMQWDDSIHAGFTADSPWMRVNPNYKWINVKEQEQDDNSVLSFYKKLINLRKQIPALIYGSYKLLMEESESIYAYTREYNGETYLIACNVSEEDSEIQVPFDISAGELLLCNYTDTDSSEYILRPYECRLYKL